MTYHIKVITGFRDDQFVSIPMQEAHNAYHLFKNPDQRGVFNNGIALVGSSIREIIPDYNKTMGWNPDYKLNSRDYVELSRTGVEEKMGVLMEKARQVADLAANDLTLLANPLGDILKANPELTAPDA